MMRIKDVERKEIEKICTKIDAQHQTEKLKNIQFQGGVSFTL